MINQQSLLNLLRIPILPKVKKSENFLDLRTRTGILTADRNINKTPKNKLMANPNILCWCPCNVKIKVWLFKIKIISII